MEHFDPSKTTEKIVDFIKKYTEDAGFSRVVLGLSGGLDSATCAYLAVRALGRENVKLVNMPYKGSSPESQADAQLVADSLGIPMDVVEITGPVDSLFDGRPAPDRLRLGNACARMRMITIYDIASEWNGLVIATGNKSESYLGYTTLWGDMAGAFSPIGDLFKSDEKALADFLGVPKRLVEKTPTADLWADQTDEGEMGVKYADADKIIHLIFEKHMTTDQAIAEGCSPADIETVLSRYRASRFKTRMPEFPLLS